jgi:hypothetical protein
LLTGLRSEGGFCCLGTSLSRRIVLIIYLASDGLNFSLCFGLI